MSDKSHKTPPYALTAEASKGNAFSRHLNGVPRIFCTAMDSAAAAKSAAQTQRVEDSRKVGVDLGYIGGMSRRADELNARHKARLPRAISFDPNPQASADKQFKIKGKL